MYRFNPTGRGVGIGDPLPGSGAPVLKRDSWAAAIVDERETDGLITASVAIMAEL